MAGLASYVRRIPAGATTRIGVRGVTIIARVSDANVEVIARAQFQKGQGDKSGTAYSIIMRPGEKWFCPEEFSQVEIRNLDAFAQHTFEFLIGYGDYVTPDARINADRIVAIASVTPAGFAFNSLLAPANPLRWRLFVQNRLFNCSSGAALNPTAFSINQGNEVCDGLQCNAGETVVIWTKGVVFARAVVATPAGTTVPQIGLMEEVFNG